MGRNIQGQFQIDGVTIDYRQARFGNTFDVSDRDSSLLATDEEVVCVVVARVSTPSFREGKKGDVKRVDVLKVTEARVVRDEPYKAAVLEALGFDYRPQPSMIDANGNLNPDAAPDPQISPAEIPATVPNDEEPAWAAPVPQAAIAEEVPKPDDDATTGEEGRREKFLADIARARSLASDEEVLDDEDLALLRTPSKSPSTSDVKAGDHVGGSSAHDPILRKFLETM